MSVFANWISRQPRSSDLGLAKFTLCLLGLSLACASFWVQATEVPASQPPAAPAPRVERLAPPLEKLAKSFKPDPKAEAEVILRRTLISLDDQLMSHSNSYVAVYINSDEAARDYSQISISFNSFYEDIALEFARVRTPDGRIDDIKPDATQIQSPSDENFYQDGKELLFSLPNVRKGSVIEFQYRYTDIKKIIPGQWFDSYGFHWWEDRAAGQGSRADAVRHSEIEIQAPASAPLYFNSLKNFAIKTSTQVKNGRKTWHWEADKLAQLELQSAMPREHSYTPYLRISSIRDWQDIATWSDKLVEPHLVTDAKLDKIIADINKRAKTPEDKVRAVYQTLQEKVRYVFAHVGRGGYEPHDAKEVFTNGYGDCKDQSVLAVTLLRKLGIAADPALIITRSRGIPDMSIPAVSFDHMIVHIPAQTGLAETWMDTTGDKALFPGFSIGIEGQPALVVNKTTQAIKFLPEWDASQHFAKLNIQFDKVSGNDVEASFTLDLGGLFEDRMRSLWQYTPEREKYFRELLGHIYSSAQITALNTKNADSLWQPFSVSGRLKFSDVWAGDKAPITYGFNINQLLYLFTDLNNLYTPENRKQIYVNDPGYTLMAHLEFTSPSPQHKLLLKSQGEAEDNAYYQLTQSGKEQGNHYVLDQRLVLKAAKVQLADYADFYQKSQALFNDSDWTISYQYSQAAAETYALEHAGKQDGDHFIALARHQLKQGQYSAALEAAKQAVKVAPKQAEAYYILGLAQGYNNQLPEADASFKKAEAMGYHL